MSTTLTVIEPDDPGRYLCHLARNTLGRAAEEAGLTLEELQAMAARRAAA